jgi:DNA repair exonuclease SbcCD nuclease subunit
MVLSPPKLAGSTRAAKVLHTSDCHLGSGGNEEAAFSLAIDLAISEDVDAVLIAGDLFDHARVPESLLEWTAKQLDRLKRPVVMIPGNHDAFHDSSVYRRFEPEDRCRQASFIRECDGAVVHVPGTDIVVWGRAMVEHEPAFRPLVGVPDRPGDGWCIVAGHGLVMGSNEPTFRSSPIYPSDLEVIDWDYVALGHCHGYSELLAGAAPACYPGATASSYGQRAGALIVDFVPDAGATPRWVGLGG